MKETKEIRARVSNALTRLWNSNLDRRPTELGPHVTACIEAADTVEQIEAYLRDIPQTATTWPKPVEMKAELLNRASSATAPRGHCQTCDGHRVVGYDEWTMERGQPVLFGYGGRCPDCTGTRWPHDHLERFRAWLANGRRATPPPISRREPT